MQTTTLGYSRMGKNHEDKKVLAACWRRKSEAGTLLQAVRTGEFTNWQMHFPWQVREERHAK